LKYELSPDLMSGVIPFPSPALGATSCRTVSIRYVESMNKTLIGRFIKSYGDV
jgi:hypothetical protein